MERGVELEGWPDEKRRFSATGCVTRSRFFFFFFTFPILGLRKGILYTAPPQHFFFTGGEVIGGVSNLAVVTRPWTGKLSRLLLDRNTPGSTNKALMGLFGCELLIWRVSVQEARLMLMRKNKAVC